MNMMTEASKVFKKFYGRRLVNYVIGKRLCPKCAEKLWKDEDKSQSFTMMLVIC